MQFVAFTFKNQVVHIAAVILRGIVCHCRRKDAYTLSDFVQAQVFGEAVKIVNRVKGVTSGDLVVVRHLAVEQVFYHLPTFLCNDVIRNPQVEKYLADYQAHLEKVFG